MQEMPPRSSIVIKRFTQTRLFDTCAAEYCSQNELRHKAEAGVAFVVIDVETGNDVTESLMTPDHLSA